MRFLDVESALQAGVPSHDVYQHPAYGHSAALIDEGIWECAVSDCGRLAFPYLKRTIPDRPEYYDIVTPYGYGGISVSGDAHVSAQNFRAAFLKISRDRGLVAEFLRLNPLDKHPEIQSTVDTLRTHVTYGSYVNSTNEEWDRTRGSHRTSIRKARREGVVLREIPPHTLAEENSAFRMIYADTMARLGARRGLRLGNSYFQRLLDLPKECVHVLVAELADEPVAAAIFLTWERRLHYHLSGATSDGRRSQATNALMWHAVQTLLRTPFALHLGGGVSSGNGLERFKRMASSSEFAMHFTETVVNPQVYAELTKHVDSPSYFPAYRRPE